MKASDLRHFFGEISRESPVFLHSKDRKNVPIRSAKSRIVKTGKILCRRCNDTISQPYDVAWERLLTGLSESWENVKKTGKYKLQKAFPGSTRAQSENLQLYFVKLMGCRIVDENIPIDIGPFSESVRTKTVHPWIFLTFCTRPIPNDFHNYAGVSEVHAKEYDGVPEMATWYYTLGELDIQLTWFRNEPVRSVPFAWHPSRGGKIIKFRGR